MSVQLMNEQQVGNESLKEPTNSEEGASRKLTRGKLRGLMED
jgi:hypothetical protein